MNDNKIIPVKFSYLGAREYVHGTTVFEELCKALKKEISSLKCKSPEISIFKIKKEIVHNGNIFISMGGDLNTIYEVSADAICEIEGQKIRVQVVEDKNDKVIKKKQDVVNDMIMDYYHNSEYSCRAALCATSDVSELIRGIVQINKLAHLNTVNLKEREAKVRWLYMKKLPSLPDGGNSFPVEVGVTNRQCIRNKHDITTMNEISVKWGSISFKTILCFLCGREIN